jgi:glyoxylase-like metal-dependent hydrolase (beta-lactamase superfamily II)
MLALLFALAGCSAIGAPEALTTPLAEARRPAGASHAARSPLDQALRAIGTPAARAAAQRFEAELNGTSFAGEQARSPQEAVAAAPRTYRWRFDAREGRAIRDAEQLFPGNVKFSTRVALTPQGGWSVDLIKWRTGTDLDRVDAAESVRLRSEYERYFPHLLLRQASEAASLSGIDPHRFRYVDPAGVTVEVTLDPATGLPARAAQMRGPDVQSELAYSRYLRRHGVMLPAQVQFSAGGRVRESLALGATRIAPVPAAAFVPPAGYALPPSVGAPRTVELAPGVFMFEGMPPFNYHSMAVDQGNRLVLLEAPLSPAYAELQRRLLAEFRPGRKVTHVLVTHHHGDHIGGLAVWAAAGATIVVAKGATIAIERQLKASGFTGKARIEEVESRLTLGDGPSRIDAYAFASSHAEAHLLMHLPGPRILFQGDLFYLPERGPVPVAFDVVEELSERIEGLGLPVTLIVGVHGRPATLAQMHESLARRAARR